MGLQMEVVVGVTSGAAVGVIYWSGSRMLIYVCKSNLRDYYVGIRILEKISSGSI